MKRNKMYCRSLIGFVVLAASLVNSCKPGKIYNDVDLETRLGIPFAQYRLSEIHIDEAHFLIDYKRPYNIYISFVADSNTALHIFSELGMVRYNINTIKWKDPTLCLYSKPIDLQIWCVKPLHYVGPALEYQKQLTWWHPEVTGNENSFVLYYRLLDSVKGKVVKCNEHHDGRIVGQFLANSKQVFILIEL